MSMAFNSSTRRSFLAGSASFGTLAGAAPILARDVQAQSASAPAHSTSGQAGSTPARV